MDTLHPSLQQIAAAAAAMARRESVAPRFDPPKSKSSAARKACICQWGDECCRLQTFFDSEKHPLAGVVDIKYSDSCGFQNLWAALVTCLEVPPDKQDEIREMWERKVEDPENVKDVRIKIARHHFPLGLVTSKKSSHWTEPMTLEVMEGIGCYRNRSTPPQSDPLMKFDPELGLGMSGRKRRMYAGMELFRLVPCVTLSEATAIAAAVQSGGDGSTLHPVWDRGRNADGDRDIGNFMQRRSNVENPEGGDELLRREDGLIEQCRNTEEAKISANLERARADEAEDKNSLRDDAIRAAICRKRGRSDDGGSATAESSALPRYSDLLRIEPTICPEVDRPEDGGAVTAGSSEVSQHGDMPLDIEPCSIRYMEDHISALEARLVHARGRLECLRKRLCKHEGCTKDAQRIGLCRLHDVSRHCSIEGCTNYFNRNGLCWRHDPEYRLQVCEVVGCNNRAKSDGLCLRHDPLYTRTKPQKQKCKVEGCLKIALQKGLCQKHNPHFKQRTCTVEGCTKISKLGGKCCKHADYPPCDYPNCNKKAYTLKGKCRKHDPQYTARQARAREMKVDKMLPLYESIGIKAWQAQTRQVKVDKSGSTLPLHEPA